jgi:hypothetical protein
VTKEEFLGRLRARAAGSHLPQEADPPELPTPPGDLPQRFAAAAERTGCQVFEGDLGDLGHVLRRAVGEAPVLRGGEAPVLEICDGLQASPQDEPFLAGWGVALADAALARTGSMCFVRRSAAPLTATLVPPRIAVLVPSSRIVWDLVDYLREPPPVGSLAIVSGPSRSADIENDLSIGVHGPGEVLVLLWRDGPQEE